MVVQINHQLTKVQWKLNLHGDLFTNGKTYTAKTLSGDFKITTLKNPLLSKQAVISKGIPIPNWTCPVVTISSF